MKMYLVTNNICGNADKPNLYTNLHVAIDCILEIMQDYDDELPYDEQWVTNTIKDSDGEFTWYLGTNAAVSYYEYAVAGVVSSDYADSMVRKALGV